jgi:hypothetical protein
MSTASAPELIVAESPRDESPGLRVLFFMQHLGRYLRFFDSVIRLMLERGHTVHLVFEYKEEAPGNLVETWLRRMERHPRFGWSISHAWRRDPWFRVARQVRAALDYVYFLQLGEDRVPFLVQRARHRAPRAIRLLMRLPGCRSRIGLRAAAAILGACDDAIPPSRGVQELVRRESPDVVLITPHLMPASTDIHYVRSAAPTGVPTGICIASWDNLSSKQLLRVVPDLVTVWNEAQHAEAVNLHGVPENRVVVTGAQCFDHWFGWPPRPREEFLARVGLDPAQPYILYTGGSLFPAWRTEAEFCIDWIEAVRASDEPALRDASILIRSHPKRNHEWRAVDFGRYDDVVLWPPTVMSPVEQESRADYFDSIHHSAVVVGVNTSAMIEAGAIGRAVHTILVPEFAASQGGVLHFRYLREIGGGLVQVSSDLDEHVRRLEDVMTGRDTEGEEAARRFTELFVRPQGIQVPATPIFVDAVEELVRHGPYDPVRRPRWPRLLRGPLALLRLPHLMFRTRLKIRHEIGKLTAGLRGAAGPG